MACRAGETDIGIASVNYHIVDYSTIQKMCGRFAVIHGPPRCGKAMFKTRLLEVPIKHSSFERGANSPPQLPIRRMKREPLRIHGRGATAKARQFQSYQSRDKTYQSKSTPEDRHAFDIESVPAVPNVQPLSGPASSQVYRPPGADSPFLSGPSVTPFEQFRKVHSKTYIVAPSLILRSDSKATLSIKATPATSFTRLRSDTTRDFGIDVHFLTNWDASMITSSQSNLAGSDSNPIVVGDDTIASAEPVGHQALTRSRLGWRQRLR